MISIEKSTPKTRLETILWTLGLIIFGVLLTAYSPFEYLFHYFGYENSNGCPLLTFTGIPCPLCGTGRSFWAIISFDLRGSVYYNPSGIVFFSASAVVLLSMLTAAILGYAIKPEKRLLKLWYIFVLLLAAMWIINILWGHHS